MHLSELHACAALFFPLLSAAQAPRDRPECRFKRRGGADDASHGHPFLLRHHPREACKFATLAGHKQVVPKTMIHAMPYDDCLS